MHSTQFTYAQDLPLYREEWPFSVLSFTEEEQSKTNLSWELGSEEFVYDIRGKENEFTLDEHGFCYKSTPTTFDQGLSRDAIEQRYLPEVKSLLEGHCRNVRHVEIFDWRVS